MGEGAFPDFTDKVVVPFLVTGQGPTALVDARFERQAGKVFLTGRQLKNPRAPGWMDGATYYVPREQMLFYAVFESEEDYRARLAALAAPPGPTPPRRGWFGGPG